MQADYLIVGQGIAGSVLAWTLHQRGHKVILLNNPARPSASRASAGIFNPLTGKKLVKTWKADELFPFAQKFYGDMQDALHGTFQHLTDIYRPYRSIEEQNSYLAQTADPSIGKYVTETPDHQKFAPFIENSFGGLQITQAGWINCEQMLQKIMSFFVEKNQYFENEFDYEKVEIQQDSVIYEDIEIKKILFCEGFEARENPFFGWLPFNPVKGQSLIVYIEGYSIDEIVNQGNFVLPIDKEGKCRIGATYSWHDINWEISEDGKNFLEGKVKTFFKAPYRILEQQAGIRPSSKDRRPFVGLHPVYKQLGIFNGLGTKGITLAPYFAQQFAQFLETGEEIDAEVNIERFFSLYFRS
ncbi:MAG: FAD-binding oxidoreductase [Spirosomaceae bacterium]|nr:FAD-binding oxidoreductase [Spirosomataceae bacterium]